MTDADRRAAAIVRELWSDYRKKNPGVSQEAAASRAGITQSAFSQFLLGRVPMRVAPVLKLAKLFDVSPTSIREDLAEIAYAAPPPLQALAVNEPPPSVSHEALEIARAWDRMGPQTKERVRDLVFIWSVVDRSFPWLRTGKPISANYDKFERNHEENMAAQLTLKAQRLARRGSEKS